MKSKGAPGTDHEGGYLVKQLLDYADSLLNIANGYTIMKVEWPAKVFNICIPITPLWLTVDVILTCAYVDCG